MSERRHDMPWDSAEVAGGAGGRSGGAPPDEAWARVERLFQEALSLPPEERSALLERESAGDAGLLHRVASLLSVHEALETATDAGAGFLEALDPDRTFALLDQAPREPEDPVEIGRYEVVRRLGRGGMGVVYLARDPDLGRRVALKLLPPEDSADPGAGRRLVREARAASALDHQNVATVFEIGETEDRRPFIAMAYYEGETLRERVSGGPLPVEEALEIASQVADGLAAAHARGVIHRDIKPENLVLTPEGVVKIVDFGVARAASTTLTRVGATPGTVAYMSPEQTRGGAVDGRSDVWSLGIVLHEMLAGRRPFDGDGHEAVIYQIRHDPPPPLRELRSDLPADVPRIVERCLAKHPEDRYASAHELADVLRRSRSAAAIESGRGPHPSAPGGVGAPSLWRHALWRTAALYIPAAWLGYYAVHLSTRLLGLPVQVPDLALALLLIGLPVVLATSYAQQGRRRRLRRHLTWRRSLAAGGAAFALLGVGAVSYTGLRTLGIGPMATLASQGVITGTDPVVLADFQTDAADPRIGRVVTEALRIDLLQSPVLRLAEPDEVAQVMRRMGRDLAGGLPDEAAREVAQREGYKALIAGEVAALGGGYVLTARLVAADDGTTLAAVRETARDSTGLIDAVDRLSKKVRERVGEPLRGLHAAPPLPRVATASLPALRRYADARAVLWAGGDQTRAVDFLEEAVALDSTFAAAHRGLAIAYWNMRADRARIVAANRAAYDLRDRLPEKERYLVEASYYWNVLGDPGRASQAHRRVLTLDPDEEAARNNLGLALLFMGRPDEAEAVLREGFGPASSPLIHQNLATALYFQGRTDAALAVLDSAAAGGAESPRGELLRLELIGGDGRWAEAQELARGLLERYPESPQVRVETLRALHHLDLVRGRLAEAETHRTEAEALLEEVGALDQLGRMVVQRAEAIRTLRGDPDGALAVLHTLLERPDLDVMTAGATLAPRVAAALAAAGDTTLAAELVERWEAQPPEARGDPDTFSPELARARIDLAASRPHAAVTRLLAASEEDIQAIHYLPDLARAQELAGRPDSAIVTLERYLEFRHSRRLYRIPPHLGPSLRRLARLYEQAGRPTRAREVWAELEALWRGADPELQPFVAEARTRVEALSTSSAGAQDVRQGPAVERVGAVRGASSG